MFRGTISALLMANSLLAVDPLPCPPQRPMNLVTGAMASTSLALDIIKLEPKGKNCVLSTLLCSQVISALESGARGTTRRQLTQLLPDMVTPKILGCLGQQWVSGGGRSKSSPSDPRVTNSGSVWINPKFKVKPDYLSALESDLRWQVKRVNLADAAGQAELNQWVAQVTESSLSQLINPEELQETTPLVLATAATFEGRWALPFDSTNTKPANFKVSADKSVEVMMMETTGFFPVRKLPSDTIVTLPIEGGDGRWSLVIAIPERRNAAQLLQASSAAAWRQWLQTAQQTYVKLRLPRFSIRCPMDLKPKLESLGVKLAFTTAADFGNISATSPLYVGAILQDAFITVNEIGVKAAALAEVAFKALALQSPPEPLEITVDRPFLFALMDRRTGGSLFLGACYVPGEP